MLAGNGQATAFVVRWDPIDEGLGLEGDSDSDRQLGVSGSVGIFLSPSLNVCPFCKIR